ncbi:unnamed protein product [Boreogadus saida]
MCPTLPLATENPLTAMCPTLPLATENPLTAMCPTLPLATENPRTAMCPTLPLATENPRTSLEKEYQQGLEAEQSEEMSHRDIATVLSHLQTSCW